MTVNSDMARGFVTGCTVTNSGLWTICVFTVMTLKRPEMTFKASEYLLIMNFCSFVPISFNYITLKYKRFQKSKMF